MTYCDLYLYSPLSTETVKRAGGKALLLQFILYELFHCADSDKKEDSLEFVFSTPACFFPFDWSFEVGCLNKVGEHAQFFSHAFEDMDEEIDDFQTILEAILDEVIDRKKMGEGMPHAELVTALSELYFKITPFLIACKESENLVLFLLKHAKEIQALSKASGLEDLMHQMFPDGDFHSIRNRYELRGFHRQQSEFEMLIAPYERH